MKNILIPTVLEPDTIIAVKAALKYSNFKCTITLLLLKEANNDYSAAAALRNIGSGTTQTQAEVLGKCRNIINNTPGCYIKVHNQAGISASLVKHITDYFDIQLVIITAGYANQKKKIDKQCIQLLLNCKCPILHLGTYCREQDFNNAFYIESNNSAIKTDALTRIIKDISPVETVASKKMFTDGDEGYIPPQLAEAILDNNTDLLIETRKPERININKSKKSPADKLGLSVLSIFEDAL